MCPITLFLPALFPNLLSFFLLSCWRPVHGISLFYSVVPEGMVGLKNWVSHGVPRAAKQLRLSFPSCKKRPISRLPDKCDDWVNDISLHVQKIPNFFIILSLNHPRKDFLNVSPYSMKLDDQGRSESQVKTSKCSSFKAQNNSHIPPPESLPWSSVPEFQESENWKAFQEISLSNSIYFKEEESKVQK